MMLFYRLSALVAILTAALCTIRGSMAHEEHIELASNSVSLKDVCANRQVPLISVSVVRKMIAELRRDPRVCPESYRQSIYELEPIIMVARGERICSDRKFNQMVDYHFRYVNPKQETYKFMDDLNHLDKEIKQRPLHADKFHYTVQLDEYNQEIMIPIAMQQFFKAWALQVSGMCKKALVDNLLLAVQTHMNDDDLNIMDNFIKSDREVASGRRTRSVGVSFAAVVYMPELGDKVTNEDKMSKGHAVLDFTDDIQMNEFMHACLIRYRPIYTKLIIPIVRLAKLGYDYMGREIDSISTKLDKDTLIKRWVALAALCEAHGSDYELVESEKAPVVKMEPLAYEPTVSFGLGDVLWIKGAEALQKEFDRIRGRKSTGMRGLAYKMGRKGRKAVAVLDPHQFAFYRRNQNTIANVLNFWSITWNVISVTVSLSAG